MIAGFVSEMKLDPEKEYKAKAHIALLKQTDPTWHALARQRKVDRINYTQDLLEDSLAQ